MTWLSEGTPTHDCQQPLIKEWATNRPDNGFAANDEWDTASDPPRHVHPGARWKCDTCEVTYILTDHGKWEQQ